MRLTLKSNMLTKNSVVAAEVLSICLFSIDNIALCLWSHNFPIYVSLGI